MYHTVSWKNDKKWDGMSPENVDLKELNLKENDDFGCGRPGFWILKTQFESHINVNEFPNPYR